MAPRWSRPGQGRCRAGKSGGAGGVSLSAGARGAPGAAGGTGDGRQRRAQGLPLSSSTTGSTASSPPRPMAVSSSRGGWGQRWREADRATLRLAKAAPSAGLCTAALSQRVAPAKARKAAEVAVVRMHHRLVVDRQSGDVRIGEQGALEHTGFREVR